MLRNQKGISVYTILSVILFIALIFILALPNFYNLDKEKNVDDCSTNMKAIWVAATDYVRDFGVDFGGDLEVLRRTPRKSDPKQTYLSQITYCPETHREKKEYFVYGKYIQESLESGEIKQSTGVVVLCPNLDRFPKHFLSKSFYENMSPTVLQNYMIEDLDYIDAQTKSNGERKNAIIRQYVEIWKTEAGTYEQRKADKDYLKRRVMPENFPNPVAP